MNPYIKTIKIKKSAYKYVSFVKKGKLRSGKYEEKWLAKIYSKSRNLSYSSYFDTERDAAVAVDRYLILKGLDPLNILKKSSALLN